MDLVALLSNMRLKLPAPALSGCGLRPDVRCGRIPFVKRLVRRRSLGAIR